MTDAELYSRVRALEIYRENHAEKLTALTNAVEKNNGLLESAIGNITEIRTTQKITHALAGVFGSVLTVAANHFWK